MFNKTTSLQREIDNLQRGRHKTWHLEALKTSTYGELGREYLGNADRHWEFVVGFDTHEEAQAALERLDRSIQSSVEYGGDDYDFRLSEEVGGHRRWRD